MKMIVKILIVSLFIMLLSSCDLSSLVSTKEIDKDGPNLISDTPIDNIEESQENVPYDYSKELSNRLLDEWNSAVYNLFCGVIETELDEPINWDNTIKYTDKVFFGYTIPA